MAKYYRRLYRKSYRSKGGYGKKYRKGRLAYKRSLSRRFRYKSFYAKRSYRKKNYYSRRRLYRKKY